MTPQEYIKNATATESPITDIRLNTELFTALATVAIAALNGLDAMKKSAFYGKQIGTTNLASSIQETIDAVHQLAPLGLSLARGHYPTQPLLDGVNPRIVHALFGVPTESGELLETFIDYIKTGKLDIPNLVEELGDVSWYQAIALDAMSSSFEELFQVNITKLHKKRYKSGTFTTEEAVNRDLVAERAQLESDTASVSVDTAIVTEQTVDPAPVVTVDTIVPTEQPTVEVVAPVAPVSTKNKKRSK
jgi:hypothetical protein